ncbi:MAG TPA: hypothetical protein VFX92_05875 [Candidatus Krumholzibacteria bacterium]|nr:hypothetical protein [Candidatus Krumholzibacteria bacterium]
MAALAGPGAPRADTVEWGVVADTLRAVEPGARITLSSPFIAPGSVRVEFDGVTMTPDVYQVNLHLGTIRFRIDIPPGTVVVVHYRRQPFLLSPVYSLRPAEVTRPDSVEAPPERVVATESEAAAPPPNLVFGGTKSVSFSTGSNRGSTLDQSLEARVEGNLTPTIKVRALLSDNNLPIQPEGNTEELQYFDRVFVEVEGPNARAAVGDISLESHTSTFSPLTRQLRGFSGSAFGRRGRVVGAAAETKGQFRTSEFRGTTGLQGPYPLLSQARNTREVIIAGTERVFADGQRLERGQNRDYIIDYDAGTITFTPRRLITTDTEIAVDYEVTAEEYDRSTVMTGVEDVDVGAGMRLGLVVAREADDKDRPKSVTFSKDDIAVLTAAGDDASQAITGGVSPTDPGKGTYVLVPADTLSGQPAFYRFDEVTGNLIVSFVEVAAGAGDYRRAGFSPRGTVYYEFVGGGSGNYVVGRELPLPETREVATARLGRPDGDITFDAEWNVSRLDRNRFSSLDDGDNTGHAGQARIGIERGEAWRAGVTAAGSVLEERFASFDRARPWYYYRDWNLEDVALTGREVTGELGASVARTHLGSLRYSLARLERDDFDGLKHEAVLNAGRLTERGVMARVLSSDMSGTGNERTRRHVSVDAGYGVWRVVPGAIVTREEYRNAYTAAADSGRAFDLVGARLTSRGSGRLAWRLDAEQRDTRDVDPLDDRFKDTRRDNTTSGLVTYASAGATRIEAQLIHRREDNRITGARNTTDLARLKAATAWDAIGLRLDTDYEVSQNDVATLQRSVVFVGEGKGDYNEQGEAVGKGKGDFTVLFLPTTDSTPVHSVGFNLRLVWKPSARQHSGAGFGGWVLRNVSLDQTLGVREESTYDPAWKVYLMLPSALQRDGTTVFGTTTLRQDWSLLDGYKNVSLVYRYLREDREDNRFEGVRENSFNGEHALRLSRSLSARLTATVEAGRQVERRGGDGIPAGTGSAYDVAGLSALAGVGVTLVPGATLDVDLKASSAKDSDSGAEQTTLRLTPRLVWRVAEQINVFGTYELASVQDAGDAAVKPIVFAREGRSHRWSITPNLRISRVISIFATYSGRNERVFSGRRVTEHEFRLETRAYF